MIALMQVRVEHVERWPYAPQRLLGRLLGKLELLRWHLLSVEERAAEEAGRERGRAEVRAFDNPMRANRAAAEQALAPYVGDPSGVDIECGGVPSVQGLRPREQFDYIAIRH